MIGFIDFYYKIVVVSIIRLWCIQVFVIDVYVKTRLKISFVYSRVNSSMCIHWREKWVHSLVIIVFVAIVLLKFAIYQFVTCRSLVRLSTWELPSGFPFSIEIKLSIFFSESQSVLRCTRTEGQKSRLVSSLSVGVWTSRSCFIDVKKKFSTFHTLDRLVNKHSSGNRSQWTRINAKTMNMPKETKTSQFRRDNVNRSRKTTIDDCHWTSSTLKLNLVSIQPTFNMVLRHK